MLSRTKGWENMRLNANNQIVTTVNDLKNALRASVKPNNYRVSLQLKTPVNNFDSKKFNLFVKSTSLPERRINPTEIWYRGRKLQLRSEQENSGDWECTVIDDDKMSLRLSLSKWFETIDSMSKQMANPDDYMITAKIYQLDVQGNPVFGVQLNNVFISSIGSINFDDSSNDQLSEFSLTFCYSEIYTFDVGEYNSDIISHQNSVVSENTNNALRQRQAR